MTNQSNPVRIHDRIDLETFLLRSWDNDSNYLYFSGDLHSQWLKSFPAIAQFEKNWSIFRIVDHVLCINLSNSR